MSEKPAPMSWPVIIAILLVTAMASGLLMGILGTVLPINAAMRVGGMGAPIGLVAATLIARRNAAMAS